MSSRTPGRLARGVARRARRALAGAAPTKDPTTAWRDPSGPELVRVVPAESDPTRHDPSLVVLLPHLDLGRMTGGPNTALSIGVRVAGRGVPVRFVSTHADGPVDEPGLRRHVTALAPGVAIAPGALSFEAAGPSAPLRLGAHEVLLATWWPTAHIARDTLAANGQREFLYLVQDFEPGFYAWSSQHALALATYGFPCRAIFNERLIRDHFAATGVGAFVAGSGPRSSVAFDPAVDRELFRPRPLHGRPRLLFYARPRNPRNAFELGLRAIRLAAQRGAFDGWDRASIGDQVPALDLGQSGRAGGDPRGRGPALTPIPWQSLTDYAELLGGSDLLVSLMLSPHTSYPPLEMAAAGGLVVTNTFGVKSAAALGAISSRIRAVAPEVEALTDAIVAAAGQVSAERAALAGQADHVAQRAADRVAQRSPGDLSFPAAWSEALGPVIDWTVAAIHEIAAG